MLKVITRTAYTVIAISWGAAIAVAFVDMNGNPAIKSNPEIVFQTKK